MNTVGYIKSFSKGQITIPKAVREALGIGDEFWLKLSVENGKIVAEPVDGKKDSTNYLKVLSSIKGNWINPDELKAIRKTVEKRVSADSM